MKLFIVESPHKIRTLQRILRQSKTSFIFRATYGHIMDLPKNSLGIDLKRGFFPNLVFLPEKMKNLKAIKRFLSEVKEVYLATDPDREGEAISYHLKEYLSKYKKNLIFKRIDLIEITEWGVERAFKYSREVDEFLYQAWLARRILDRLIGYLLSPLLSKFFKESLSVGRVQSPALKLIVEREKEIDSFSPKITYSLEVLLDNNLKVELYHKNRLYKVSDPEELKEFFESKLKGTELELFETQERRLKRAPPLPLKTTTLIEWGSKCVGLEPKEIMKIAQRLYEEGYITYMRTDSTRVSPLAQSKAKEFIQKCFGSLYLGKYRRKKPQKFSQEAHECIRPTKIDLLKIPLGIKENELYELIWKVFIASQMASASYLEKTYFFRNFNLEKDFTLRISGKTLLFDGFQRILKSEEKEERLPELIKGEKFKILDFILKTHKTSPPPRYTPQSLIKKLESLGIGRPSTYPTILDILYKRGYVVKRGGYLQPTELGKRVCEFLESKTPLFMEYQFTANMEEALDKIYKNQVSYLEVIEGIYEVLKKYLKALKDES
ncbi:MAG: type I DNA topoisomerase [Thermodesulfobacteriaceae bacterium]|nr:type I DNA topoisomerase [Thermodesulfobacteriaceae bacterium]